MSEKKLTRYASDHNGYMVPTKDGPYVSASDADSHALTPGLVAEGRVCTGLQSAARPGS